MAQKTNLNINPYYDDFDSEKNFYKVLFKPGYPVQARELTSLQSILQDQIQKFGSFVFKDGSVVSPGGLTYDNEFYSVKLNAKNLGVDVSVYIKSFLGKTIIGQTSGTSASVRFVALPDGDNVEDLTIYVKYKDSDNNNEFKQFVDGEFLYAEENITYGNTTISAGTNFASLISLNATATGSAASINQGTYFVRGFFVDIPKETIILDYYTNTPSYRIGLKIDELLINAKDDESLFDNAKGFSNYAAPGADRLKISLSLTKKLLTDKNDTNFIELMRVDNGVLKKVEIKSDLANLGDIIAERTYEESGHYTVKPFNVTVHNSLNDKIGNNGLFLDTESTDEENTPSNDLMCVKLSPGEAYVRGYNFETVSPTILDVEKPRDTQEVKNYPIPFEFGNLLRVTNVSGGAPQPKERIDLQNAAGTKIGESRFYTFNVTGGYNSTISETKWDLYLYDVQTYTKLTLNKSRSLNEANFVKGKNSGATGFVSATTSNSTTVQLRQTSGTFVKGEPLLINGVSTTTPVSVNEVEQYDIRDVKRVDAVTSSFAAYSVVEEYPLGNGVEQVQADLNGNLDGTIDTLAGQNFNGLRVGDYIVVDTNDSKAIVRVKTINSTTQVAVEQTGAFQGYTNNALYDATTTAYLAYPRIRNDRSASLVANIPNSNISDIDLSNTTIKVKTQIVGKNTNSSGELDLVPGDISDIDNGTYDTSFDEERYTVFNGGTPIELSAEQFSVPSTGNIRISGLTGGLSGLTVDATVVKSGIQSKVKNYNRSTVINVTRSRNQQTDSNDDTSGLTYNSEAYGLRIEDEEISLNYPDVSRVLAIYESNNANDVILDKITLSDSTIVTNAIVGENIEATEKTNNCVARIVGKSNSTTLEIVYLNDERFKPAGKIKFKESNVGVEGTITQVVTGSYNDLTDSYTLDGGQRGQYYDYSRIVRKRRSQTPTRRLKIIFDNYTVPSTDDGDVFTVLSYDPDRYEQDVPNIGPDLIRASDTLDFRPRVSANYSLTNKSPFDFAARTTGFASLPKLILKPQESSTVSYDYYLPRIDKVFLSDRREIIVKKGVSSGNPVPPNNSNPDSLMEIGSIQLPPYLYSPQDAVISLTDNRRYTMRDIGSLEDRIEVLENVTSLSLLELNTENLQITDSAGNNRFKSGFFADDFRGNDFLDANSSAVVDEERNELKVSESRNSLDLFLVPSGTTTESNIDYEVDYALADSNTIKKGDSVLLNYDEADYIEQPLATRVENVNPFHVIQYNGTMKLQPNTDSWTRVVRLGAVTQSFTRRIAGRGRGSTSVSTQDVVLSRSAETFIRRSNIYFLGRNLKPLTRYYQFFDGNGSLAFVPKLLEISPDDSLSSYGSSGAGPFQQGEQVVSYDTNGQEIGLFRLCYPDHKFGPAQDRNSDNSKQYNINPYVREEGLPQAYSQSSKVLNIGMGSLSARNQYYGYAVVGGKLLGRTSGAEAYVKDLRLVSDNYGDVLGCTYIKDPLGTPTPAVRITTGTKTLKLTNSITNEKPLKGSKLLAMAEATYTSTGIVEVRRQVTTVRRVQFYDPLAQSFVVGGDIDAPDFTTPRDDDNGVFVTSVDLFFANKPGGNDPLTVEIRTVELGTVSRNVVGNPVTITPDEITTSRTGEIATKVTFDEPIYLAPSRQYAIVLVADTTDQYEVWIAQMGERTVNTQSLPDAESVIYSKQFALGRLYKSQNGAEWTANDYQDMKFKLYKAEFTTNPGTVYMTNPELTVGNEYIRNLPSNPVVAYSKTGYLKFASAITGTPANDMTPGRKIFGNSGFGYGFVTGIGNSVTTVSVGSGTSGIGYSVANDLETTALTGSGTGLEINVTSVDSNGAITGVAVASGSEGTGYVAGDIVGITTTSGKSAVITIATIESGLDTVYLNGIQGHLGGSASFAFNHAGTAVTYTNDSDVANQQLGTISNTSAFETTGLNAGNVLQIFHENHGMYYGTNKVDLKGVHSDVPNTTLSQDLDINETSTLNVADGTNFTTFEGITVGDGGHKGYLLIGDEVIEYSNVTNNAISISARGKDSDRNEGATGRAQSHASGIDVYKYEFNGISLRRINKVHDIADSGDSADLAIGMDSYFLSIDTSDVNNGGDRSADDNGDNTPELSFTQSKIGGGNNVYSSENIIYDRINPSINVLTPSQLTTVESSVRTTSGSSVSGTEVPFLDNGFQTVELDGTTKLNTLRLVASKVNEDTYLNDIPRNKSLTMKLTLKTSDKNISPIIDLNNANVELLSSRLNNPVSDYTTDEDVHTLEFDTHASIYLSNIISLTNPATSLKVIVGAFRPANSNFRVLYELVRPDSAEVAQRFELFPGYDNLEFNSEGDLVSVDVSKNSGLPDTFVPASLDNQFRDYEFTANNLPEFTGFRIKIVMSGTDQANPPRFRDFRAIALA